MTTAELIEQIKTALSSDATLTAWCQQTFGKSQTVCIDVDENNPPNPETDYPIIVVASIQHARGDSSRELCWELEMGVGVVNETIEVEGDGRSRTLTGFIQVETLRELAENALYRARIADVSTRGATGSSSYYPLFISGTILPIRILKSNRRGLPG